MNEDEEEHDQSPIIQPYDNRTLERKIHCKHLKREQILRNSYFSQINDRRLRSAASTNNIERLNQLLEQGVNPNSADENGRTALHFACCKGYSNIVQLLLTHRADCNVVDKLGNTPLHLAVCTTSKQTIDLLLKAGGSVTTKGNNGCTPLQLAQSKLWLLQRASAARGSCPEYSTLKSQVSEVIEMMRKLVDEESEEAKLVEKFSQNLYLTQTSEQIAEDVKQLLHKLDRICINQSCDTEV